MERNFSIEHGVVLRSAAGAFDVFNAYTLEEVSYEPKVGRVTCQFRRDYDAPTGAEHKRFVVAFSNVEFVELAESARERAGVGVVDEVGFKAPDDRDLNWLGQEGQQRSGDHLIFRLSDGGYLRVLSQQVDLLVL